MPYHYHQPVPIDNAPCKYNLTCLSLQECLETPQVYNFGEQTMYTQLGGDLTEFRDLSQRETKWIFLLNTMTPRGVNIELDLHFFISNYYICFIFFHDSNITITIQASNVQEDFIQETIYGILFNVPYLKMSLYSCYLWVHFIVLSQLLFFVLFFTCHLI